MRLLGGDEAELAKLDGAKDDCNDVAFPEDMIEDITDDAYLADDPEGAADVEWETPDSKVLGRDDMALPRLDGDTDDWSEDLIEVNPDNIADDIAEEASDDAFAEDALEDEAYTVD